MRRAAARLRQCCQALHLSPSEFATHLELPTDWWTCAPAYRPRRRQLARLVQCWPHVSEAWLCSGTGDMFTTAPPAREPSNAGNSVGINYGQCIQLISTGDAALIAQLRSQLQDKDRIIQLLSRPIFHPTFSQSSDCMGYGTILPSEMFTNLAGSI